MKNLIALLIALAIAFICGPAFAQQQVAANNVGQKRNGLPPTNMDSFVWEAQGEKEHIYGDEGTWDIPPYFGFNYVHRINNGIYDRRDAGLTTGHGAYMPSAWGADEFLSPPGEWSNSGANGGNANVNGVGFQNFGGSSGGTGGGGNGGGSGQQQPVQIPYAYGPDWAPVMNTHNGQLMGYMAPGETYQQFFSGESGHLLPGYEAEGQYILQNQLGGLGPSPWGGGF